jgi:hypothetical protein
MGLQMKQNNTQSGRKNNSIAGRKPIETRRGNSTKRGKTPGIPRNPLARERRGEVLPSTTLEEFEKRVGQATRDSGIV